MVKKKVYHVPRTSSTNQMRYFRPICTVYFQKLTELFPFQRAYNNKYQTKLCNLWFPALTAVPTCFGICISFLSLEFKVYTLNRFPRGLSLNLFSNEDAPSHICSEFSRAATFLEKFLLQSKLFFRATPSG